MAKNDVTLLDALIDQRAALLPGADRGEVFEYFVLQQVLKSFDLSEDDIDFGWTDGKHDGGVDGFYTFVNDHLVTEPNTFPWPRSSASVEVFLITCKHRDTFKQEPLDAMLASLQEVIDLSKPNAVLAGAYSADVLRARDIFLATYRQLSLLRPSLRFQVVYASRGNTEELGESIRARGAQIETLFKTYFSASDVKFETLGAAELVELYRQTKSFSLSLPFLEQLTADQDGYVVLASLLDYSSFVSDERGALRRYLFDSNVRDFLGDNVVNSDIAITLRDKSAPNFWWLNNGVTILATSATVVGKQLQLKDIQIVNGLQTTESIYRYFADTTEPQNAKRSLLVKVIVSDDEKIRDQVIRATNNQSAVQPAALHATEKIQHDIEQILAQREWYYERRTNYFRNAGKLESRIVAPLFVASGVVSIIFKNPVSPVIRQKDLRIPEAYDEVFSLDHPILIWPAVVESLKLAEAELLRVRVVSVGLRPRFLATWRGLLSFLVVAKHFGTFHYSAKDVASLKVGTLAEKEFADVWELIRSNMKASTKATIPFVEKICNQAAEAFNINGKWMDARRPLPKSQTNYPRKTQIDNIITAKLLEEVDCELPEQPWKPRMHLAVAEKLKLNPQVVWSAIQELIHQGRRYIQKDGVVYDNKNRVYAIDTERTDDLAVAARKLAKTEN